MRQLPAGRVDYIDGGFRILHDRTVYGAIVVYMPGGGDHKEILMIESSGDTQYAHVMERFLDGARMDVAVFYDVKPGNYMLHILFLRNKDGKMEPGEPVTVWAGRVSEVDWR